jgi:hypothetical protein
MVGKNDKNKSNKNSSTNNDNNDDSSSSMMMGLGGGGVSGPMTNNNNNNNATSANTKALSNNVHNHNAELDMALDAMWKKAMEEINNIDSRST